MAPIHYHAVVIGSGQGGGPLAQAFAKKGHRTALIESTHVGGTCINEGCTPTKTMVASARAAHVCSRGSNYGVEFKQSSLAVNMRTVRQRKRDIVDSFRGGGEKRLRATANLDVLMGQARFTGPREIEVTMSDGGEMRQISFDKAFINTGCEPSRFSIEGSHLITVYNSTTIMELAEVPKHLVVVGGGYVGVEFAQMFRRFGARVSIVQRGSQLLPREDSDIADAVKQILTDDGIEIYLNATASGISTIPTGQFTFQINLQNGETKSILASHLLAAAGRTPNTADLGLDRAGVQLDKHGFIKVDDKLQTNVPEIYALGDVKGGPQFTHISYDDFRILRNNLLPNNESSNLLTTTDRIVPYTVFIDPQLGRVGLSLTEATSKFPHRNIKVAKMPMEYVARALEMDESRGFMKAVVDADSKEILGFACLGIEGGELMSMVQIAMMGGVTYDRLEQATFAHPCLSECLNNLWGFLE